MITNAIITNDNQIKIIIIAIIAYLFPGVTF